MAVTKTKKIERDNPMNLLPLNVLQIPLDNGQYVYYNKSHNQGEIMANILDTDKQIMVIAALAEGSSIRSIERITGIHRDTVMRLGVKVGKGCAKLLDGKMHDLSCRYLQFDEIWGFVGKKQRHVSENDSANYGDVWT